MNKIILKIGGMSCSGCSSGLEKYLKKQSGIIDASVNLVMANASVSYENISIEDIERYINEAGFESLGIEDLKKETKSKTNEKRFLILLIVLALIISYVAMGHMIHLYIPPFLNMLDYPINYSIALLILTLPILYLGKDLLISGYKNLIHKTPNMDSLVSIGVVSALVYSIIETILIIMGNNHYVESLYYESAAIIITFVKIGKYIDQRSKNKTKEAIKGLVELTPYKARIKKNNQEILVTIDEIKKGDLVICKPGEKIAVDGIITSGKTHINESFITGESIPVSKEEGSSVIAGSINYGGYIIYEAVKIGKDSTVSEIVRLVLETMNTKAPISRLVDQISGYFVPVIIMIASISFITWLVIGESFSYAINIFITTLVIACPCALGLATPLAIVISSGLAAKKGILVKTSTILENAYKIKTIVFDKTGTLTKGKLSLSKIYNYSHLKEKELLKIVGSIENKSEHPIARALVNYLKDNNIKLEEITDFKNIAGYGVKGIYNEKEVIIGNKALMDKNKITINNQDENDLVNNGNSILYISINKELVALIGVKDEIKDNIKEVISSLKKKKIKAIMLTGDNLLTANSIAREIGIDEVIANVLPKDKAQIIKELKKDGLVMMVGDGINDAISLAEATIGVSIGSGTDIAIDSADVIIMNNDLNKINDLIYISKRTIKNIKENLFWAFFYNILMIPIAVGLLKGINIIMNPMLASLAMTLSSLTVVFNALRLRRIK